MKRFTIHRFVPAVMGACLLLLAACATTGPPVKMVPYLDYSTFTATGKTIRVSEVQTGEMQTPFQELVITGEAYRNALRETLGKTGMFQVVPEGADADYEFRAEIVSQRVIPGLTANAILFVHYRMIDGRTKEVVFKSSVPSQKDSYGGDLTDALESTARENIAKIMQLLSARSW